MVILNQTLSQIKKQEKKSLYNDTGVSLSRGHNKSKYIYTLSIKIGNIYVEYKDW